MKSLIFVGALGALATGIAIGIQATLSSRIGGSIGNFRTGLLTNLVGGLVAGILVLILYLLQGKSSLQFPTTAVIMLAISGTLGIMIITGIAFSLQRTGVAAGLATIILGQLVISIIIDTKGTGGVEPIPLTLQRALGLLVMAVAVYLLLPGD